MTEGTELTGLEGTNPLGFLAALGVQTLFEHEERQPRLWWTDDIVPHAVINCKVEAVVQQAERVLPLWGNHNAFNPGICPKADLSAKFKKEDIRTYLKKCQDGNPGSTFASALLAEGSLDKKGVAKPSDLYFTAGRLLFIKVAKEVIKKADREAVFEALEGRWTPREVSSLGWDPAGYIPYSLAASKPGTGKKQAYPGVEALAILGMSRHPVFLGKERTLTQGCSGSWQQTQYTWPLWKRPAGYFAVSSILSHARSPSRDTPRSRWYRAWGITMVLQSQILRDRGQGGGVFGPPVIIWANY